MDDAYKRTNGRTYEHMFALNEASFMLPGQTPDTGTVVYQPDERLLNVRGSRAQAGARADLSFGPISPDTRWAIKYLYLSFSARH